MTAAAKRVSLSDFALANPLYADAQIAVLEVDADTWQPTATLAPLYTTPGGTSQHGNPLKLDGDGKWRAPVYVDRPVIIRISGAQVPNHDTAVAGTQSVFVGDWAPDTKYYPGNVSRDGAAGAETGYLYTCNMAHRSTSWAADLLAEYWTVYLSVGGIPPAGTLLATANLSDVSSTAAARSNLGLNDAIVTPDLTVISVAAPIDIKSTLHFARDLHLAAGAAVSVAWWDTGDGFECSLLNRTGSPLLVTLNGFTTSTIINPAGISVIPANARVTLRCVSPDGGTTKECWCG